ncbi:MAG: bifunctional 4-hydroxy-2-oxoglutarate aldolase/2-dehydro-3-deoxy-phosphogluconate aldolase [Bifidobacteriaceae bacterium]|jgi:2-dehydro-3-deoxyphosphogluconate aldolase/(4S)-4-hydroxy-2-oxoglutarate aldolase|nr:bifunctional 4-hydroxy-2-oxoglutarate aldolase/2-dehydro-3-deoxy-phosphogluconate aldolase [Bifidobacteriaceae bacterium]
MNILDLLPGQRIIPLVVLDRAEDAIPLARALLAGGITVMEVAFRSEAAADGIDQLRDLPGLVVGAGTVTSAAQVDQAAKAGARFLVSPGTSEPVVARAAALGLPLLPGVATASEIIRAVDLEMNVVKLFPASVLGGQGAVKALSAAFPAVQFVPTGGIGPANASEYLALRGVAAVGGSWITPAGLVRSGKFAEITRLAGEAIRIASGAQP